MFEHLKAREIAGKTAWISLPAVSEDAALQIRPAAESNHGYQNAILRKAAQRKRSTMAMPSVSQLENSREEDRALYPQHIIVGWKGIVDSSGLPVQFNTENCIALCKALPGWIFDRVRVAAMTPETFLGEDEDVIDPEKIAGN